MIKWKRKFGLASLDQKHFHMLLNKVKMIYSRIGIVFLLIIPFSSANAGVLSSCPAAINGFIDIGVSSTQTGDGVVECLEDHISKIYHAKGNYENIPYESAKRGIENGVLQILVLSPKDHDVPSDLRKYDLTLVITYIQRQDVQIEQFEKMTSDNLYRENKFAELARYVGIQVSGDYKKNDLGSDENVEFIRSFMFGGIENSKKSDNVAQHFHLVGINC